MQQLRASQVADWARQHANTVPGQRPMVLDVREAWELQTSALPQPAEADGYQVVHMPMRTVPARYLELDKAHPIACLCHHGARSMQVAHFLEQNGFSNVANVQGGINAWSMEHDPSVPLY
jgi:rhodanese-related sulfurtransferase